MVEVGGQQMPVSPQQWDETDLDMEVHVALTPEESTRHAQSLMMMHQTMLADPQLAQLYGLPQRHKLMDQVFEAIGIADSAPYLMRPDSPEFQQQMQQTIAEAEERKQIEAMTFGMQSKLQISADQREWKRLELAGQQVQVETANKMFDNELDEDKFTHSRVIDFMDQRRKAEELEIEKKQNRPVAVS